MATMILVSTKVPIATHCTCLLGHFWARAVLVLLFRGGGGLVVAGINVLFTILIGGSSNTTLRILSVKGGGEYPPNP